MGLNLIDRMNDVLWGCFIQRLSPSPIYVIPTLWSGVVGGRHDRKIRLLKGACHSELTGHHVIAQSSCSTTFRIAIRNREREMPLSRRRH
jgi:hypothetical protein